MSTSKQVFWLRSHSEAQPYRAKIMRRSGMLGAVVVRYSGATVRDLHPVPYSPATVAAGTQSGFKTTICGIKFKELHII
jgi:hypothetical protein